MFNCLLSYFFFSFLFFHSSFICLLSLVINCVSSSFLDPLHLRSRDVVYLQEFNKSSFNVQSCKSFLFSSYLSFFFCIQFLFLFLLFLSFFLSFFLLHTYLLTGRHVVLQEETTVTSLSEVGSDIWAGTAKSGIIVIDAKVWRG